MVHNSIWAVIKSPQHAQGYKVDSLIKNYEGTFYILYNTKTTRIVITFESFLGNDIICLVVYR